MVESQGDAPASTQMAYYSDLQVLAAESKRFCVEPNTTTESEQLADRYRVMKEVGAFADFRPTNEKDIEDWVDVHSRRIKSRCVCVSLFKELWAAACGAP
eukprot:GHVQ01032151.1.p2 GENE.GHVQ01032151.1~~GHVQ01032151.1.p2  ORF type:complete len:100 (-),score=6.74 GHVQ01032151.1:382-681(-)